MLNYDQPQTFNELTHYLYGVQALTTFRTPARISCDTRPSFCDA
jgi:hypothetical protein